MEGAANRAVSDLNVETFANVTLTLDAYEERFIPRAAAQLARAEFDHACQASNETVFQWHTRLREIFSRAYPERAATADRPLIDKFTIGLVDSALARHMLDHQPATFAQALQTAQSKQATEDLMAARYPGQAPTLSAMSHPDGRSAGSSGCWYCQEPGHQRSDCSKFMQQKEIFAKYFKIDRQLWIRRRQPQLAWWPWTWTWWSRTRWTFLGPTITWDQLSRTWTTRKTRRAGFGPASALTTPILNIYSSTILPNSNATTRPTLTDTTCPSESTIRRHLPSSIQAISGGMPSPNNSSPTSDYPSTTSSRSREPPASAPPKLGPH